MFVSLRFEEEIKSEELGVENFRWSDNLRKGKNKQLSGMRLLERDKQINPTLL